MKDKDFFISYNKNDKQWAKWIAGILEENGFSTIIQAWDFRPGNNFILEMQNALKRCRKTIIVLSENYLTSEYCLPEWATVFNNDPTGKRRILIPVRVANVIPDGLLSSVIYIDLFEEKEDIAIKKLLNGIDEKDNPRKKPIFPGKKNDENFPEFKNQEEKFKFLFQINAENKAEAPIKTKNLLRTWYVNECKSPFEIVIIDKRVELIQKNLSVINEKIRNEEELSIIEEKQYNDYTKAAKNCEYETKLKTCAGEFFLKDKFLHAYLSLSDFTKMYEVLKTILEFDCFNDKRRKINDSSFTVLDFTIYPSPKECNDYFVVPIETSKIIERFGGKTNFHIAGYASDLGSQIIKEIVVYFYMFLAEEMIGFGNSKLIDNKKVLDLFNYHIGLH